MLVKIIQFIVTNSIEYYFQRDINCVRRFFRKRFGYEVQDSDIPKFDPNTMVHNKELNLDVLAEASGFSKKKQSQLDSVITEYNIFDLFSLLWLKIRIIPKKVVSQRM